MVKVLRSSGAPLSEAPLPPVHRTAILTLNWWQYSLKLEGLAGSGGAQLPTPKIRTSHFLLALAALGRLDPTDELYVPSATAVARPFSLLEVLETILKILKYLERAYKSALTLTNSPIPGPSNLPIGGAMQYTFPLVSRCRLSGLGAVLINYISQVVLHYNGCTLQPSQCKTR